MDGWMNGWDLEILGNLPDHRAAAEQDTGQDNQTPNLWAPS